jgi:hypothetical protein
MIWRRQVGIYTPQRAASQLQTLKGLWRRHFVQQL